MWPWKLAIKGHPTRGKEIIEFLEMLGGRNILNLGTNIKIEEDLLYTIRRDYHFGDVIEGVSYAEDTWILTDIEECLKLYPFKVGDKVHIPEYESEVSICKAKWNPHPFCRHVEYLVQRNDEEVWYSAQELKECNADFLISILVDKENSERLDNIILDSLYKEGLKKSEENNEERKYAELRMPLDDDDKLSTEVTIDGNKIFPPNNYLIGKVTQVDNGMLVEFVKKQLKYPKTYKECCEVLDIESEWHLTFELNNFAVVIRNHKNKVSEHVNQNLLYYLEMSKFTFLKEMRNTFKGEIPSSFDVQLYTDMFDCYQNKFEALQKKLQFENITFQGFEFYKRNTKNKKKGEFKKVKIDKKQTPLSNCLTYLARYGNDNTVEYISKQLQSCDSNKTEFYNNILRCIDKFGFDRLMNLALSKRISVIKYYSRKPIEFKSLTFRGRSRKTKILDYNSNYNSVIKTFISLSGFKGRKSLDIPVKFSKDYHGNIKEYLKSNPDYEYLIKFDEYHKNVTVNICKDGKRYIPEA